MLNKSPLFVHAYHRGGSNMIMNLLLSHPDICLSNGETHKVFKGTEWDPLIRKIKKKLLYDAPINLLSQQNLFFPRNYKPRKQVSDPLKNHIDRILYKGRFIAMIDTHNRFKSEELEYTKEELAKCRLLTKGLDGLVFTVDMFDQMYPDAVFFGFVRNGLAVCEGFVRRGMKAEEIAHMYKKVARKIIDSTAKMENYHMFFYEDMVKDPLEFMRKVYLVAELDIKQVPKIRLQSKGVMQADGKRIHLKGKDRQVFWHDKNGLRDFIKTDINENQIKQLKAQDKNKFLSIAGDVMEELGYSTN